MEKFKKQKMTPNIHAINESNESPEPCNSYETASNRSRRKTQESAKESIQEQSRK